MQELRTNLNTFGDYYTKTYQVFSSTYLGVQICKNICCRPLCFKWCLLAKLQTELWGELCHRHRWGFKQLPGRTKTTNQSGFKGRTKTSYKEQLRCSSNCLRYRAKRASPASGRGPCTILPNKWHQRVACRCLS